MKEIECVFEEVDEWNGLLDSKTDKTKFGRYDGSNIKAEGVGVTCWPIVANILPENSIREMLESGMSESDIVHMCVKFLNKKPYRARKLRYGELKVKHFIINVDKNKISASLTTTERNSKFFWGRGSFKKMGKLSKRGRPRKSA